MRIQSRPWIGAVAAVAVLAVAASAATAHQARPAKIVQLSYYEDREDGHRYNLQAHALRTDGLKFSARRGGRRITAEARLNENLTDTDLPGQARHPWVPKRNGAGKRLIRAVVHKLHSKGEVALHILARGIGGNDFARMRIVLSECSFDPPLYPDPDCEVQP
jgi:hypothetical protein